MPGPRQSFSTKNHIDPQGITEPLSESQRYSCRGNELSLFISLTAGVVKTSQGFSVQVFTEPQKVGQGSTLTSWDYRNGAQIIKTPPACQTQRVLLLWEMSFIVCSKLFFPLKIMVLHSSKAFQGDMSIWVDL